MVQVLAALDVYAAAFLALLLVASAGHKLRNPARMRASVEALTGLGGSAGWAGLGTATAIELGAGLGLLWPAGRAVAATAAAALWAAYAIAIVLALRRGGPRVDCGCTFGARRDSGGPGQVRRNLVLIALALFTAQAAGVARPLAIGPVQGVAALAFFILYLALDQIAGLAPARSASPWAS